MCTLSSMVQGWIVHLHMTLGHLYNEWSAPILYTETELMNFYRHFYHPDSDRFYYLMKRAVLDNTPPQVLSDLNRVNSTCSLCWRLANAPHRFRVSLPDNDLVFNHTLCMDLIIWNRLLASTLSTKQLSSQQQPFFLRQLRTTHGMHSRVSGSLCISVFQT